MSVQGIGNGLCYCYATRIPQTGTPCNAQDDVVFTTLARFLNVLATRPKLTGMSSIAMPMPKVFRVATLLATTHDEFSILFPNGSKPVISIFTLVSQYYTLSCNIPY